MTTKTLAEDPRLQQSVDCSQHDGEKRLLDCLEGGCFAGCEDFDEAVSDAGISEEEVDAVTRMVVKRLGTQTVGKDSRNSSGGGNDAELKDDACSEPLGKEHGARPADGDMVDAGDRGTKHLPDGAPNVGSSPDPPLDPAAGTDGKQSQPSTDDDACTASGKREARTMPVDKLHPNKVNGWVFTSSLEIESIQRLASDIEERGLRQPIEATPEGVILDGERRWRALKMLDRTEIDVIFVHGVADDDVDAYVFDAFSNSRVAAIDEKVRVFQLGVTVLQKRYGRPVGAPKKSAQIGADYWDPKEIRDEAARCAGFSSRTIAESAARIFREGDEELRRRVLNGEVAISTAIGLLPKKKRQKKNPIPAPPKQSAPPNNLGATDEDDVARGEDEERKEQNDHLEHEADEDDVGALGTDSQEVDVEPEDESDGIPEIEGDLDNEYDLEGDTSSTDTADENPVQGDGDKETAVSHDTDPDDDPVAALKRATGAIQNCKRTVEDGDLDEETARDLEQAFYDMRTAQGDLTSALRQAAIIPATLLQKAMDRSRASTADGAGRALDVVR